VTLGNKGRALIQSFEGCRLESYRDVAGVLTIGYGHTGNVTEGQTITPEDADRLFDADVAGVVEFVNRVAPTANQNQFDALCSFAYNLGTNALGGSSVLRCFKIGRFSDAARSFSDWDHAGGVQVPGLTRRRQAEANLFLEEA